MIKLSREQARVVKEEVSAIWINADEIKNDCDFIYDALNNEETKDILFRLNYIKDTLSVIDSKVERLINSVGGLYESGNH